MSDRDLTDEELQDMYLEWKKKRKQEYMRNYFQEHKESFREAGKKYYKKHADEIRAKHREYYLTHKRPAPYRSNFYEKTGKRYIKENPEKNRAHEIARLRIVIDGPCAICGGIAVHKHHYDYSKPLSVVFMCVKCHSRVHRLSRMVERAIEGRIA